MSHFVIDKEFDRKLVTALKDRDKSYLAAIPQDELQSGTSELKSWLSLAGVLENETAPLHEIDYVPCYRSPAGTGTANGFIGGICLDKESTRGLAPLQHRLIGRAHDLRDGGSLLHGLAHHSAFD